MKISKKHQKTKRFIELEIGTVFAVTNQDRIYSEADSYFMKLGNQQGKMVDLRNGWVYDIGEDDRVVEVVGEFVETG